MRRFIFLALALTVAGIAAILIASGLSTKPQSSEAKPATGTTGVPTAQPIGKSDSSTVSGSKSPKSDAEGEVATADKAKAPAAPKNPLDKKEPQDYGKIQPVKGDVNLQAASVREALKTKTHPERLSAMMQGKPFNAEEFNKNPDAYLNVVEPGRVFSTANPSPDVPILKPTSPNHARIAQGESVKLSVQSAALAPVTFTSFDLGAFKENSLNSITVRADKDGVAQATFVGTPGTLNDCNILAGSPLASGRVQFQIEVTEAAGKQAAPKSK